MQKKNTQYFKKLIADLARFENGILFALYITLTENQAFAIQKKIPQASFTM